MQGSQLEDGAFGTLPASRVQPLWGGDVNPIITQTEKRIITPTASAGRAGAAGWLWSGLSLEPPGVLVMVASGG